MSIDQQINDAFEPISKVAIDIIFYAVPIAGEDVKLILVLLGFAALFFTFYLGFINVRFFKHAIDVARGKYSDHKDGEITPFQALATSLSGTVGLGNIGGVAVAVSVGGPGAAFWMVILGFLAMSSKFAEVMLGVKYRVHASEEHPSQFSGGPMYYLPYAFERYKIPYLGKAFAGIFAFFVICGAIGGGNMYQANQAVEQIHVAFGFEGGGWIIGAVIALMVGSVIIGGLRSIASIASKLVPIMGGLYLIVGLVVIGMHYDRIAEGLITIFEQAFNPDAAYGAILGVFLIGLQRAAFSNEAGLGSAAIVHSAAKTDSHVRQGMVGMLGPFIDTIVICSVTSLVIVISGAYQSGSGIEGVELTSRALESAIPGLKYLLAVIVFLFAFSTLITWSYYGLKGVTYLLGDKDYITMSFKIFYCLCVIVGASANLGNLIDFSDAMILSMAIPNIIGLFLFAPEIRRDVKAYIADLKAEKS